MLIFTNTRFKLLISVRTVYLEQYVGSVIKFKSRFRIHKSDITTKNDRCGTARYFNNKCCNFSNPFVYLRVQLIEKIYCIYDDCNIEDILWDRQTYWQSQLFTNVKGMNSISDLYSVKRKVAENTNLVKISLYY